MYKKVLKTQDDYIKTFRSNTNSPSFSERVNKAKKEYNQANENYRKHKNNKPDY